LIEMSLCLSEFESSQPANPAQMNDLFVAHRVEYETFAFDAYRLMQEPDLVIRIDKTQYYTWKDAQAILMSYLVFKSPLPLE